MSRGAGIFLAATVAALGGAGCSTEPFGGARLGQVQADLVSRGGLEVHMPAVIEAPAGQRFHGWVCRRSTSLASLQAVRLERIGADSALVEAVNGRVNLRSAGQSRCAVYDIPTDWTLGPGETVRLCPATSERSACPVGGAAPHAPAPADPGRK